MGTAWPADIVRGVHDDLWRDRTLVAPGFDRAAARMFRGKGFARGVQAVQEHHTAQPVSQSDASSVNFLARKGIGNIYLGWTGVAVLLHAGPTYTSGRRENPLMGMLRGNSDIFAIEIANPGTGAQDYHSAQIEYLRVVVPGLIERFAAEYGWGSLDLPGGDWWRLHGHHEWAPKRKGDPAGEDPDRRYQDGTGLRFHDTRRWNMHNRRVDTQAAIDGGAPPAPVVLPPASGHTITVERGEGWWAVAARARVAMSELLAANGATVDRVLHPGDKLSVPGATPPPPKPVTPKPKPPAQLPVLRIGSSGAAVRFLQQTIHDHAGGHIDVDGKFGPQTARRVRDLQRFFGLAVDGWVGPQTWGIVTMLAGVK